MSHTWGGGKEGGRGLFYRGGISRVVHADAIPHSSFLHSTAIATCARNGREISSETTVKYSRLSVSSSENVRTWNSVYLPSRRGRYVAHVPKRIHGICKNRNVINEAQDFICLLCHFLKRWTAEKLVTATMKMWNTTVRINQTNTQQTVLLLKLITRCC